MTLKFGRRAFIAAAAAIGLAGPVTAGGHQVLDSIHFLIPGGAGGGLRRRHRGGGPPFEENAEDAIAGG